MNFCQDDFITNYGQKIFMFLKDFLYCENEYIFRDLEHLIKNENIKSFYYEGNKYGILKKLNESTIIIIDETLEENGGLQDESRCSIAKSDFLYAIAENKNLI
ncbi:MAG: hypothetical protein K2L67_04370 [Clostridia bacterium]|nr:hypothetical protein [Clostridia bacterium]